MTTLLIKRISIFLMAVFTFSYVNLTTTAFAAATTPPAETIAFVESDNRFVSLDGADPEAIAGRFVQTSVENGYIWILADNKLFCYNPSIDNIQKIDFLLLGEEYFTTNSEHKIYPNPSTHQITITGENILQVKAYDMSGQFLGKHIENFGKKSVTIELSTLGITTKGYYVLCIEENTSIYHHKIQVKK